MPEKPSNEQKHERIYCAFTHWRIALSLAALCAVNMLITWKGLDKPDSLPLDRFELSYFALVVAVGTPAFMMVLRCFSERFVIGVVALAVVKPVFFRFAPTLLIPIRGSVDRTFLALWTLAFLVSLNMLVRAVRHPYVGPEYGHTASAKRGVIILSAFVVILVVVGTLMYFVP